jgi:hypothetical protein
VARLCPHLDWLGGNEVVLVDHETELSGQIHEGYVLRLLLHIVSIKLTDEGESSFNLQLVAGI